MGMQTDHDLLPLRYIPTEMLDLLEVEDRLERDAAITDVPNLRNDLEGRSRLLQGG